MWDFPEHPEIERCLNTGYPSWMQEGEDTQEIDEDALYEEKREEEEGWR